MNQIIVIIVILHILLYLLARNIPQKYVILKKSLKKYVNLEKIICKEWIYSSDLKENIRLKKIYDRALISWQKKKDI